MRLLACAAGLLAVVMTAGAARADLLDPVESFETLAFVIVGVQNDESGDDRAATIIHCTNLGDGLEVRVEIFASNGAPIGSSKRVVQAGQTETWQTQPTFLFGATTIDVLSVSNHISARIVALAKKPQLICSAFVVDPDGDENEPVTLMALPVWPAGKLLNKVKHSAKAASDVLEPLDSDQTLAYIATGVANDTEEPDEIATVFVCTNVGKAQFLLLVEFYDSAGDWLRSSGRSVAPGATEAVLTQDVATLDGSISNLEQILDGGFARVVLEGDGKFQAVCNAYLIDPNAPAAKAGAKLPLFRIGKAPRLKPASP